MLEETGQRLDCVDLWAAPQTWSFSWFGLQQKFLPASQSCRSVQLLPPGSVSSQKPTFELWHWFWTRWGPALAHREAFANGLERPGVL